MAFRFANWWGCDSKIRESDGAKRYDASDKTLSINERIKDDWFVYFNECWYNEEREEEGRKPPPGFGYSFLLIVTLRLGIFTDSFIHYSIKTPFFQSMICLPLPLFLSFFLVSSTIPLITLAQVRCVCVVPPSTSHLCISGPSLPVPAQAQPRPTYNLKA